MGQRQQASIPFANALQGGLEELGGASPAAFNVIVRGGVVQRRPGIGAYAGASPIVGSGPIGAILVTQSGDIYAVSGTTPNRYLYRVTPTAALNLSTTPESDLRGTGRPQMVETESILAIAGGDRMQKLVLATGICSPLANAPQGSYLAYHNYRLLTDNPDIATQVDFSDEASGPDDYSGFETWGTGIGNAGFIPINAKPSTVQGIAESAHEVFGWTKRGLQVFAPVAGPDWYSPTASQEFGCAAPYSIIKVDQSFAWLDHLRRIVLSDGRSVTPFSTGIQKLLNDMSRVDDCYGYRFVEGDVDILVWTFPTDGRTFAYQQGAGWSEWSLWNTTDNNWAGLTAITTVVQTNGTNLFGSTTGILGELSLRHNDQSNAHVITGFQNRGTENRKTCNGIQLTLRRGQTAGSDEPSALVSWRDDLGPWNPPLVVGLGAAGETEPVVNFYGLGVYRRRQWKFTFTGADDLQLVAASETFTIQGN